MAPLHNRRKQLAAIAAKEASGESFWTDKFDSNVRVKLSQAMSASVGEFNYPLYLKAARQLVLEDEGITSLSRKGLQASADFVNYLLSCADDMVPTLLEAFSIASRSARLAEYSLPWTDPQGYFCDRVNAVLAEHRVAYELVAGEMVPFTSKELHAEVVLPVLNLISEPGWEKVEVAYQSALSELTRGDAADAVTDAGTALQEGLVLLGAEGKSLGPLIVSARKKGIILGHDSALMEVIDRAATWVSADRSQVGDSHNVTSAEAADAWLTVHIVGAILLRLSKRTSRPAR